MTWKTHLIENVLAVRVQCSGSISLDDLTMFGIEAAFLAKEHDCKKMLVDISDVALTFPTAELGRLMDIYAEYRLPATTRLAIVLSSKDWPENFAKVVAAAHGFGYDMEFLVGERQVKAWLSVMT